MAPPDPTTHGASVPGQSPPNGGAAEALQMEGVSVRASGNDQSALLERVDWRVVAGDFWVVGGLAGSGKSQLLQTAAGLLPPLQGTVRWFGQVWTKAPASERLEVRKRLGFLFPDGGRLLGGLTTAQNLALPLCYHQDRSMDEVAERVEELLAQLGLQTYAGWLPGRMSRGWRQRSALARALALKPEVLFLDNPLAGLDPEQVRWWLEFLPELAAGRACGGENRLTLVVAADDLRPWLRLAQQFALLKDGRFLPLGGPEAIAACQETGVRELLVDATRGG